MLRFWSSVVFVVVKHQKIISTAVFVSSISVIYTIIL